MHTIVIVRRDTGGEGSRGGTVIGRTSSGRPIYRSALHGSHKRFSSVEHTEASALHRKLAKQERQQGSAGAGKRGEFHDKQEDRHANMATVV